jgi:hypothetical protein
LLVLKILTDAMGAQIDAGGEDGAATFRLRLQAI